LPMGSRLYSRQAVESLLADAGVDLVDATHDFVLPYGFYRSLPTRLARPFRKLDRAVGSAGGGDRVASVSYWVVE